MSMVVRMMCYGENAGCRMQSYAATSASPQDTPASIAITV